ncbi:ABC transporter permease [Aurantibacillus circumpalustris]|uniref:ABC transporter permease n=1 Tax=Aurantibacillus circumpalustris TaxID=3036359 RepID=UPI00295C1520|nr:ABC transporter permease [Aurantibacillus circumpalustris]
MRYKIWAAIKKEILILIRDRIGLSILFLMPMILIFVMTLIQDSAFKSINEKGIPIVLLDNDRDSLGIYIKKGLQSSSLCSLHDSIDGLPATAELIKRSVSEGKFIIGIVIPKGATEAIRKNVSSLVSEALATDPPKNIKVSTDSVNVLIYIDPVSKKSFISSVTSNLHEFISVVKTQIMFQTFSEQIREVMPDNTNAPKNIYSKSQIINYKEIYASNLIGEMLPNAVQHNVPAWTIFSMFFIVIPLAGSIMKEKKEGSSFRIRTMPSSYLILVLGKIIVYVFVCLIQFLLMLSVGLYILPLVGLPVLQLGNSYAAIALLALATSFAATGYGVMVGTLASSEQQGAILGALSILLLSALGGVWVPTYVMPEIMRHISVLSPLNWSLEGFYALFLRGSNMAGILIPALKLFLFFIFTMGLASIINRVKHKI